MTNTVAQAKDLVTSVAATQPWWVTLLVLLIVLALSIVWAAHKCTIAIKTFAATKIQAEAITSSISSLLASRSRQIGFLAWLLSGAVLAVIWFASSDPVSRSTCLLMVLDGGVFFTLLAYLIVEVALWKLLQSLNETKTPKPK